MTRQRTNELYDALNKLSPAQVNKLLKVVSETRKPKRRSSKVFPEENGLDRTNNSDYDVFKKRVLPILKRSKTGLTWEQIRSKGNFKQRVPYNGWVRSLESDIGLVRSNGLWRLH